MNKEEILKADLSLLLKRQEALIEMQEASLTKLKKIESSLDKILKIVSFQITNSTEIEYPNVFTIQPPPSWRNKKSTVLRTEYELQLYCAHKDCIHPVGKPYSFTMPKQLLKDIAPYANNIIKGLQAISIFIAPAAFFVLEAANYAANKPYIKASKEAINKLELLDDSSSITAYENRKATPTSRKRA